MKCRGPDSVASSPSEIHTTNSRKAEVQPSLGTSGVVRPPKIRPCKHADDFLMMPNIFLVSAAYFHVLPRYFPDQHLTIKVLSIFGDCV